MQLYDWFSPSVRPSVRHTFFTMFTSSYHHEIVRSYYHRQTWCPCKRSRSKVKVTEVNTQLSRFQTLTPVWIHIWQWNHAHSWKQHRKGALLFFKVIRQIFKVTRLLKSSNLTQIRRFRTVTPVLIHQWLQNDAQSLKKHIRGVLLFFKVSCQVSRSHGYKNRQIWPRLGVSGLYLQFEFTNSYEMIHKAWSGIEEVSYCFSRSAVRFQGHAALKIVKFDPDWAFPDCISSLNSSIATKWYTKLEVA